MRDTLPNKSLIEPGRFKKNYYIIIGPKALKFGKKIIVRLFIHVFLYDALFFSFFLKIIVYFGNFSQVAIFKVEHCSILLLVT